MTTTPEAIREIKRFLTDEEMLNPRLRDALETLLGAVEAVTPTVSTDTDVADLVQRLLDVAAHDWRTSILAHTPDTAKEAADRLERLQAERNHWIDVACGVDQRLGQRLTALEAENKRLREERARIEARLRNPDEAMVEAVQQALLQAGWGYNDPIAEAICRALADHLGGSSRAEDA